MTKKMLAIFTGQRILLTLCVIVLYGILFIIYYARFTSFIFFDEYATIIAGHLLAGGRTLYSEQFFNHQMLPVYLSSALQLILKPESLYQLILYHRIFIFLVSVCAGVLLIYKLRWVGLGIVILYEFGKYYLFGYLFLAEGIIVYINIGLFYLVWKKAQGNTLSFLDLLLAALGTWFVVFSREPYTMLALCMYGYLFLKRQIDKKYLYSLGIFVFLSVITLITIPLRDYIYEVVYVNYKTVISYQVKNNQEAGLGLFSMFFYPLYIFMKGELNFFRIFLMGLSAIFITALGYYVYVTKKYLHAVIILILLGLANIRMVQPGTIHYSAFYSLQWYALFVTAILLQIHSIGRINLRLMWSLSIFTAIVFGFLLFHKESYVFQKVDREQLFSEQYNAFYITGQVINTLAGKDDTLFVEFSDSLLFWEADIAPAFPSVVYYPVMHDIPDYQRQRTHMFISKPPVFYYTNCNEGQYMFNDLPEEIRYSYAPFRVNDAPTCFYVRKERAKHFTDEQLKRIGQYNVTLSPSALD
jgi:hypothetical protein